MDRFVIRKKRTLEAELPSSTNTPAPQPQEVPSTINTPVPSPSSTQAPEVPSSSAHSPHVDSMVINELSIWDLPADPAKRKPISSYHPNDQDKVRRAYMQRGPCQPKNFPFPQKLMGTTNPKKRRFNEAWFLKHGSWLEYSISKDAAFCLPCYLFRNCVKGQGVSDAFVNAGFSHWSQPDKFDKHVGNHESTHNDSCSKSRKLMQESQHIDAFYNRYTEQEMSSYKIRLTAIIDCIRFLLCQALAFRGHDESDSSRNQGNFKELFKFLAEHNDIVKNEVINAPGNHQLTCPDIQKQIVSAAAMETMDAIREDIGDSLFAVMVDESKDVSVKEQMAVVIRYVNKKGEVIERFIGVIHVLETTAISLKTSLDALFSKYGLNIMRLRGQCYDGASNMQGVSNGLKALILQENPSAYVIHCFAHQLQLALVHAAVEKHNDVALLFTLVGKVVTMVSGSCKRRDILREKEFARVVELVKNGERSSGTGQNQETCLKRAADTRWGTHYTTLVSLILMFPSILQLLEIVSREGTREARGEAQALLILMPTFDFVFTLFLVRSVLGITNELSQTLQRKDQEIVNAMNLVRVSKERLQAMRDEGWDSLMHDISIFCANNSIEVPDMTSPYVPIGRGRRNLHEETNLHHFQVGFFNSVIDMQIAALNDRFDECNTELLLCMSHLNPRNKFAAFDKGALIRLAELYPTDFSQMDLMLLDRQLDTFLADVLSSNDFLELKGLSELAQQMVKTKRDIVYPLVYLLITLSLILPVATATVERVFSAMNIVKNRLRNRIGNEWLNNCLLTYIERELFLTISNDKIIKRFQGMTKRRGQC